MNHLNGLKRGAIYEELHRISSIPTAIVPMAYTGPNAQIVATTMVYVYSEESELEFVVQHVWRIGVAARYRILSEKSPSELEKW